KHSRRSKSIEGSHDRGSADPERRAELPLGGDACACRQGPLVDEALEGHRELLVQWVTTARPGAQEVDESTSAHGLAFLSTCAGVALADAKGSEQDERAIDTTSEEPRSSGPAQRVDRR